MFYLIAFVVKYALFDGYRQHGFMSYKTSQYKLNLYETASGLKFVINTDTSVGSIRDVLHHIYSSVKQRCRYFMVTSNDCVAKSVF